MNAKEAGKKTRKVALRLLWPGAAIKKTIELTRKSQEQHKNNRAYIDELYQKVRKNTKNDPKEEARADCSFEDVISNRSPDSPSIPMLYDFFLFKKRLALAVGAVFIALGIYALVKGTWLGVATVLASPPVFFIVALSAQLRLWQLRTRRLSRAEKGGLQDFLGEIRGWGWEVLDPELSRRKGAQP